MKRFAMRSALFTGIVLTGCGGGGGGGEDLLSPPAQTHVSISSANQQAVARSVVNGGMALMWSQPLAAPGRASALGAGVHRGAAPARLLAAITQRMARLAEGQRATALVQALAASTETEACSGGGTVATTFDDRDNNGDASAGDVITADFSACREADLITLDGRIILRIATVAEVGDDGLDLTGSFTFDDVSAVVGDTTAGLSGGVAISAALRSESLALALTVGSDALRVEASAPGYAESMVYDSGMRISIGAADSAPSATTLAIDGAFASDLLGGRVTVVTAQPVRQFLSDDYPTYGQVLVSGAAGSQLRITVQDATTVRLEIDANGDGTFEALTQVGWSALLPA